MNHNSHQTKPEALSRRSVLRGALTLGAMLTVSSLPVFEARAAVPRPAAATLVPDAQATVLWYGAPGAESAIMQQGLPTGNGRIGAMTTGDPSYDAFYISDATLWTGGLNATLGSDGQFPYGTDDFGTFGQLTQAYLSLPAHTASAITDYQRRLDLSNGLAVTTYQLGGVTYRREVFVSHPDDLVVIRLSQSGGGSYAGSLTLKGTRGESVTAGSFSATLANGLKYAATLKAAATTGTVSTSGSTVSFSNCQEVVLLISGGTTYSPTAPNFIDTAADPLATATATATSAAGVSGASLLATHVADYQRLQQSMTVSLGTSTADQRAMDTPTRLAARAATGAAPDPELDSSYLQFGRYLMITGSRTGLPLNLQGLWIDTNSPSWMSDYHTDINVQMNYWLPDRAGLSECFTAFADYCVSQYPSWQATTQALFNDSRNGFRNTSGKIAGWTVGISTNPWGGSGWWWQPAGSAWLSNSLYEHYEYTQDQAYLSRIYPLLKGACEFWQARLITTTVNGAQVLVDDHDWSPEQGPTDAIGITFAQELVWQLFQNYRTAATTLGLDSAFAATVTDLQSSLYLPQVSATTGRLEEWMTDANLGETTHRHLSPLIGLFPGDRISPDTSPAALVTGATNLLTARGMQSFGWACAWRALCWARLHNADKAYQLVTTVMTPSVNNSNGAAANMLDMYSLGSSTVFQIDANFGTPSAMLEMLLYSRPGRLELLPAVPSAWAAAGSVTGVGARGGLTVDFAWTNGQVATVTLHGAPGTTTTVQAGTSSTAVTIPAGGSYTFTPAPGVPSRCQLVNRASGKVIDVPGSATSTGTALIQYASQGSDNQHWNVLRSGTGWQFVNVHSALAMDVNGGSTAPGTPIIQWTPGTAANQQWTLTDAGGGYVTVNCVRSGLVLGVAGDSTADLAVIQQQTATGSASQQWLLQAV